MIRLIPILFAILLAWPARADLSQAKAEAKPDRRAEKALDNADFALKSAREAYTVNGDAKQTNDFLREVADSVELAYASLKQTGKNPSKSPKHFKKAEIKTRELLRLLDDFRQGMSFQDRDQLDQARAVVQKVHEDLLEGIMGGKK